MFNIEETVNKGVIYKLESPSGKVYIGQSVNFKNRIKKYKRNDEKSIGKYIHNAIKKYGFEKFDVEIVAYISLDDDIVVTKNELDRLEISYIEKFDSFGNGYNSTAGGSGSFKRVVTCDTRLKLSNSNKGKNYKDRLTLICPICNKEFYLKQGEINGRLRTNKNISTIRCSRSCGNFKLNK